MITKKEAKEYNPICGEVKDLEYSPFGKLKKLNLELCKDKMGSPCIMFEDWTIEGKEKPLFVLHIKEAVELKSMIDNLIIDWNSRLGDEINAIEDKGLQEISKLKNKLLELTKK